MTKIDAKKKRALEEVLAFCGLVAENFRLFTSEIIGYDNAPFHEELDDYLSNAFMRNLVIALPRGFGKTNHLAIAYPLWEIARNHNIRILLVSSTGELSRKSLASVMDHIERNPRYKAWAKVLDGNRAGVVPRKRARQKRDEHWSAESIIIERDEIALRDATIQAVGLFGSILSRRADIIILDDVVTQENAATEDQRTKVKEWFRNTLLPVLVPGGRVICLGNTWHMDDLMHELLKDPQFHVKKRVSSILHEANRQDLWQDWANILLDESLTPEEKVTRSNAYRAEHKVDMDEGTEVLWPERFPYADLYLKRIADPFSFARMYMCDPSIRPNQKFFEKDIEAALAKGKDMTLQDAERTEYETEMTTGGLDLAASLETWGDDTVLLTLDRVRYGSKDGVVRQGDYIIRNIQRGQFTPNETRRMILENEVAVKPVATRVETNGMQEMMYRDLGDSGALVTSYKTGGEKNDPAIGVHSLAVLFEQGKIILPNSPRDARTRRLVAQLVNEMRAFPDGHTGDSLMALWFAFSEIRDRIAGRIIIPASPHTPPPVGPQTETEADRAFIAAQEIGRSGDRAAALLLMQANEALERAAPSMPKQLDPDLDEGLRQKLSEGWTLVNAQTWAWSQQSQRHAKKYWEGTARRALYGG
jgi:hypothetical protein